MRRDRWRVLPRGVANSPTRRPKFAAAATKENRKIHPEAHVIRSTDDVFAAHRDLENLKVIYSELSTSTK